MLQGIFQYATSVDLREIAQDKYPVLTADDPVLTDIMPVTSVNAAVVEWEQRDSYRGLMQPRTLGGPYSVVDREGIKLYRMDPGYYGDSKVIDEDMITRAREIGNLGDQPIDLTKQQGRDQDHLLTRGLQRLKKIGWDFVTTGVYTALDKRGNVVQLDSTPIVPFTTAVSWATVASATPIKDLRTVKLRHRGHSVSFGRNAKLYLNSQDVINLLSNTNANDLGGRFRQIMTANALVGPVSLKDVNTWLLDADLPQIVEWDDTYIDDAGNVQTYLQQGYGALVGARDHGEPVAEFVMTRNAEIMVGGVKSKNMGGIDNLFYDFELKRKPVRGISTMGFNGAPAIYYPSAVVPFRC